MNRPKVVAVAIRFQGKVYSLPAPNRHRDLVSHIIQTTSVRNVDVHPDDEGFLDENGRYLNRRQALLNAELNNQIIPEKSILLNELYSDNIW